MRENRAKRLLAEGGSVVGAWMCTADPMLTETVADCGFDLVVIDTEHAAQTHLSVQAHLMALKDTGATAAARVVWNDFVRVKRLLDMGAEGVVFPWVNTPEEAEQAVRATRYPPRGLRGFGPRRAQRYGDGLLVYFHHADANILVLCQVETPQAVAHAEAIAAVDGVDALMVGPADLSVNLGVPLDWECEAFLDAVRRVAAGAEAAGKAFGVISTGVELASRWIDLGARVVIAGADHALLRTMASQTRDAIRQALADRDG
ncbi:MAG: HpcH/HpaI aldolase family protein [Planctomycetota bacterium]